MLCGWRTVAYPIEVGPAVVLLRERTSLLRVVDRDFVTVEKPFATPILVAVKSHKATVERHTKHLDHCPHAAHERWRHSWPPLDVNPISTVKCWLRWLECFLTHWLPPFRVSRALNQHLCCALACSFHPGSHAVVIGVSKIMFDWSMTCSLRLPLCLLPNEGESIVVQ